MKIQAPVYVGSPSIQLWHHRCFQFSAHDLVKPWGRAGLESVLTGTRSSATLTEAHVNVLCIASPIPGVYDGCTIFGVGLRPCCERKTYSASSALARLRVTKIADDVSAGDGDDDDDDDDNRDDDDDDDVDGAGDGDSLIVMVMMAVLDRDDGDDNTSCTWLPR